MMTKASVILLGIAACAASAVASNDSSVRAFPDGFMFGAATAAYQIEGAWNVSGKSESIWDHMMHDVKPCFVASECSNGDDACKSWYLWERDVEMVKSLGLDYYRFSISWPRVLPGGFANETNQEAIDYYNNLINKLLENNIKPMVTIYHWDIPQSLQDLGGFANPLLADWLGDFARVCFENFGDRVKYWITINEPRQICLNGYGEGSLAPLVADSGVADYLCSKHLLLAHARMYQIYDQDYRATQEGTIGITMSARWYEPESSADEEAAEDTREFEFGLWANPIFGTGNWPARVIERVANNSAAEGFPRSRLPTFTNAEITALKGSSDFFGLNHYTTSLVYRNSSLSYEEPSNSYDINAATYQPDSWKQNATSWVYDLPWGFYKLLVDIKDRYNSPKIFITENGYAEKLAIGNSQISDDRRVHYLRGYLSALLDAVDEGCDIASYTVWSLMDNFSWKRGLATRFGLFETDMTAENRTRTPRKSAYVYKQIISERALDLTYEPDTSVDL